MWAAQEVALMRRSAAAAVILVFAFVSGCTRSRTFTIYSKPGDARLVINGVERGPGPITQRFDFAGSGGTRRITAVREGYKSKTETVSANTPLDTVVIELEPIGPKVVLTIEPVAAMVRVNGVLVRPTAVTQAEISLDPTDPDKVYTVTAEQTGYTTETRTVGGKDPQGYYRIQLKPAPDRTAVARANPQPSPPEQRPTQPAAQPTTQPAQPQPQPQSRPVTQPVPPVARPPAPMRRDIVIRTEPANVPSEIFIGDEKWGDREVRLGGYEFRRDAATGRSVPQQVRATAPGFEGGRAMMRFEDEKPVYVIPLGNRRKEVRIMTDPPGAAVTLGGKVLPRDRNGFATTTLTFPPTEQPGKPTTYVASAEKEDTAGWEPGRVTIGWDEGRADYEVKLAQSKVVKVPMLQVAPAYDAQTGWRGEARRVDTLATRETSEGPGRADVLPLSELPAGTMLGSVVASPDGTHVLYTELISPDAGAKALRSRMRLLNSDGTPAGSLPSTGEHLDAMPSFTPDGGQIVFTSDRSGEGLDVWRMPAAGAADPRRIARGGEKAALWPMIDASPRPRLFYEEFLKPAAAARTAAASEIHMVELESNPPTNMALAAGTRPRASPRADAVVFTVADPDTGNRDLYLVSDADGVPLGGEPVNLTNTPDVDEYDPAWSRTGGKIAYASNAGADETNRRNYDLYVLTVAAPDRPVRITYNGSHDDSPAWDATGRSLYFRSNRGGKWGIWKAPLP
jgi:hypothetical protein